MTQRDDVQVERPVRDLKPLANDVLAHIASLGFQLPRLAEYLAASCVQNSEGADRYLKSRQPSVAFNTFIEHLEEFKARNGHLMILRTDISPDGYRLGDRNHFYRHIAHLNMQQRDRLADVGFVDDHWKEHFETRFAALLEYAAACGGLLTYPLPRAFSFKGQHLDLQQWSTTIVAAARRAPSQRQLCRDKRQRLTLVPGWRWDYRKGRLD
jgi:hypothetical protein